MTQPRRQLVDPTHAGTFQCVLERLIAGRSYQTLDSALSGPRFPALRAKDRCDAGNPEIVAEYRSRLANLLWLMKSLSELIARNAVAQDNSTGRFWEIVRAVVLTALRPDRSNAERLCRRPESTGWRRGWVMAF